MPLLSMGQMLLLTVLLHLAASLAPWDRDEDVLQEIRRVNTHLTGRNHVDSLAEERLSQRGELGLKKRQLGDIEFSNRYAEYLRSKAKHSSVCAFLRRLQSVKKSGLGGDAVKVNVLLKQYMCPTVYTWPSDL